MKGYRIQKKIIEENKSVAENTDESEKTFDDEINILNYVKKENKDNIPLLESERIIEDWFPKKEHKQVFISHSHEDEKTAKKLSRYLKQEKGWDCFIDSEVWGSCYKLIHKIDDEYNRVSNKENTYTYQGCQKTTSDIYLMLTTAINKVINTCPIFIFIESESSVKDSITYSPWIMEELNTYLLLRSSCRCMSSNLTKNDELYLFIPNVQISYKVNKILDSMEEIKDISDFHKIII